MDLVERLYRRLVEAAADRDGGNAGSFTIADLYQHLIPYRSVRGDLGVLELAEYEHALLRLLAGEGGFLRLLDEDARRELAAELIAPNPILGIYRDYAALGVELLGVVEPNGGAATTPPLEPAESSRADLEEERPAVRDVSELTAGDVEEDEAGEDAPPLPEISYPSPRPFPADATRVIGAAATAPGGPDQVVPEATAGRCVSCHRPLPDAEGLRYCPHCGADQTEIPCGRCATPIRSDWNFCIRCGAPRPPVDDLS
jgi:hypothetical protein